MRDRSAGSRRDGLSGAEDSVRSTAPSADPTGASPRSALLALMLYPESECPQISVVEAERRYPTREAPSRRIPFCTDDIEYDSRSAPVRSVRPRFAGQPSNTAQARSL